MADTKKKKRASLSSFTILLIILVALAVITVIMAACGVEGIEGATLSGVLTAPVFGFQDAIGVCLFVMILGGFLGIVTETGGRTSHSAIIARALEIPAVLSVANSCTALRNGMTVVVDGGKGVVEADPDEETLAA